MLRIGKYEGWERSKNQIFPMNALGISFFQTFFSQIFCLPIFLPFVLPFGFLLSYSVAFCVLAFIFCLSCSAFYVLPFMFCLPCSAFHVLPSLCPHPSVAMTSLVCVLYIVMRTCSKTSMVTKIQFANLETNQHGRNHRSFNQIGNLEFCNHKSHRSFHI